MGAVRVEIFTKNNRFSAYPDGHDKAPVQVNEETSTTAATTAGSRITVGNVGAGKKLFARVQVDEACYMAIGTDPTASATALGYKLAANVPFEVECDVADKFSFKDLA